MLEGLDMIEDGSQSFYRYGYRPMDVFHFNKNQETSPFLNSLYSLNCGAKSEIPEVLETISEVDSIIDKYVAKIIDWGMDCSIYRDFIILAKNISFSPSENPCI